MSADGWKLNNTESADGESDEDGNVLVDALGQWLL